MNPEGKATLAELLHTALKSVTITQGESGRLPIRDYRRVVQQYRVTFNPALRLQASRVDIQVGDPKVREAILTLLRDELKPFLREDRTYSASFVIVGGMGGGSSVEDILNSVVKSAIVFGPDQSASEFYGAIKLGYITCQQYFLLAGMRIEKEIQVLDGITLIPLPNDTSCLPSFLPAMFNSGIDLTPKTLLRADVSVSPLLHKPAQDYTLASGPDRHFKTASTAAVTSLGAKARTSFKVDSIHVYWLVPSPPTSFSRDSPDQTTFPGYSSRGDTAKYNPAFQGRQMRSDAA